MLMLTSCVCICARSINYQFQKVDASQLRTELSKNVWQHFRLNIADAGRRMSENLHKEQSPGQHHMEQQRVPDIFGQDCPKLSGNMPVMSGNVPVMSGMLPKSFRQVSVCLFVNSKSKANHSAAGLSLMSGVLIFTQQMLPDTFGQFCPQLSGIHAARHIWTIMSAIVWHTCCQTYLTISVK